MIYDCLWLYFSYVLHNAIMYASYAAEDSLHCVPLRMGIFEDWKSNSQVKNEIHHSRREARHTIKM